MPPKTIDDIIDQLNGIIADARAGEERIGFFATLYRNVTIRVKQGIAAGTFEDGPRMERLDVIFAGRYLEAMRAFRAGEKPNGCWLLAFDAAGSWPPIILQHLLLGINAHINLDLGVAAAQTAPGDALGGLKNDFNTINDILASMVDQVRHDVEEVSPWIRVVDTLFPDEDVLIHFGIDRARANAWRVAARLASLGEEHWIAEIDILDSWVTILGNLILHPAGVISNVALGVVRGRESNDVEQIMEVLSRT